MFSHTLSSHTSTCRQTPRIERTVRLWLIDARLNSSSAADDPVQILMTCRNGNSPSGAFTRTEMLVTPKRGGAWNTRIEREAQ